MTRRHRVALGLLILAITLVGVHAQRGNDRNRDEWQEVTEIFSAMETGEGSVVAPRVIVRSTRTRSGRSSSEKISSAQL
jgi:hypothetical protein